MLIVNPIYNIVFKYLMQNIDIAKGVIASIINEEIEHLDFSAKGRKKGTVSHDAGFTRRR